jgi:20S proteasome alpha/beta subunit
MKWKDLNGEWRAKRETEAQHENSGTLRPISNSLLVIARQSNLESISIIDHDGKLETTQTFVISGSGSYLVEQFLRQSEKSFSPAMTLDDCFDLLQGCYRVLSRDLYVIGYPAVVLVSHSHIRNFSDECAKIWSNQDRQYFGKVKKKLFKG